MMGGCCGWGGWWGMSGFGWIGLVFNLILWVLIILAVVWGIRWILKSTSVPATATSPTSSQTPTKSEDPRQLLQLRYARGEITREEYLQMLKDLEGSPQ